MLNITTIQSDIIWENKPANLSRFECFLQRGFTTDVVVLPEMFTTGFSMNTELAETMQGESVMWMRKMSIEKGYAIIGSLIIEDSGKFYNRMLFVQGNEVQYYDKRHLFSYAGEDKHYTAGIDRKIVVINGWRINLQICYDLRFPVFFRNSNDYDVMIYVANWPEKRRNAWKTLLEARAIENQSYVIGVNRVGVDAFGNRYSGDSSVIDPVGNILYRSENCINVQTVTLQKDFLNNARQQFQFLNDADKFKLKPF